MAIHLATYLVQYQRCKFAKALHVIVLPVVIALFLNITSISQAQDAQTPDLSVFTREEWKRVDAGVDRGLSWLALQQQPDGSFPTYDTGQPAVTSLCVMAFLSRGHSPGVGIYGKALDRAIDFVISQQHEDGLLFKNASEFLSRDGGSNVPKGAMYNHAISGLMLGEVYGMTDRIRAAKIQKVIDKSLKFARNMQRRESPYEMDKYAWRYYNYLNTSGQGEADLSVTGWYLMFYRSAKNAEFDVPENFNQEAMQFVRHCYIPNEGAFNYGPYSGDQRKSRAMTGAGVLSHIVTGNHNPKIAADAQRWMLQHPFDRYNSGSGSHDRYHYGAYYCSQAMFMLGGEPWKQFYKPLADTMLASQSVEGAWQPERAQNDSLFGPCYTTAMAILSLTPPYQMLPIYQR